MSAWAIYHHALLEIIGDAIYPNRHGYHVTFVKRSDHEYILVYWRARNSTKPKGIRGMHRDHGLRWMQRAIGAINWASK